MCDAFTLLVNRKGKAKSTRNTTENTNYAKKMLIKKLALILNNPRETKTSEQS